MIATDVINSPFTDHRLTAINAYGMLFIYYIYIYYIIIYIYMTAMKKYQIKLIVYAILTLKICGHAQCSALLEIIKYLKDSTRVSKVAVTSNFNLWL